MLEVERPEPPLGRRQGGRRWRGRRRAPGLVVATRGWRLARRARIASSPRFAARQREIARSNAAAQMQTTTGTTISNLTAASNRSLSSPRHRIQSRTAVTPSHPATETLRVTSCRWRDTRDAASPLAAWTDGLRRPDGVRQPGIRSAAGLRTRSFPRPTTDSRAAPMISRTNQTELRRRLAHGRCGAGQRCDEALRGGGQACGRRRQPADRDAARRWR